MCIEYNISAYNPISRLLKRSINCFAPSLYSSIDHSVLSGHPYSVTPTRTPVVIRCSQPPSAHNLAVYRNIITMLSRGSMKERMKGRVRHYSQRV